MVVGIWTVVLGLRLVVVSAPTTLTTVLVGVVPATAASASTPACVAVRLHDATVNRAASSAMTPAVLINCDGVSSSGEALVVSEIHRTLVAYLNRFDVWAAGSPSRRYPEDSRRETHHEHGDEKCNYDRHAEHRNLLT